MNSSFVASIAAIRQRMADASAEFDQARGEVAAEIERAQEQFRPPTDAQERALTEHYRSGAAGPAMRDLQRRVDRGETTWDDIKSGRAEPELVQSYLNSQSKLGSMIKAASEGQDLDEFLAEQHEMGNKFAPARPVQPSPPPTAEPKPPRSARRRVDDDDDEDLSGKTWLR
ncbi:MAG TPA: hypothetical protein VG317_18245 [Pseudonocardiaceae bacterium]|nr:hypothetical protein [Pseudonocardiaceae bacterium]